VLAVVGNDPFGAALERATAGQSVNGRVVVVKRWKNPRELGPCHAVRRGSDADEVSASSATSRARPAHGRRRAELRERGRDHRILHARLAHPLRHQSYDR
jgi:hypothetical protein